MLNVAGGPSAMRRKPKILEIIPADRWYVKNLNELIQPPDLVVPLICWALIQDENGETWVEGMENGPNGVTLAEDDNGDFAGYIHESQMGTAT
jgi:hypothetical protein